MKKLANIKFWSFLFVGLLCIAGGIYVFTSGIMSDNVAAMLILAAVVQLTFFYLLLFFWKRKE